MLVYGLYLFGILPHLQVHLVLIPDLYLCAQQSIFHFQASLLLVSDL